MLEFPGTVEVVDKGWKMREVWDPVVGGESRLQKEEQNTRTTNTLFHLCVIHAEGLRRRWTGGTVREGGWIPSEVVCPLGAERWEERGRVKWTGVVKTSGKKDRALRGPGTT